MFLQAEEFHWATYKKHRRQDFRWWYPEQQLQKQQSILQKRKTKRWLDLYEKTAEIFTMKEKYNFRLLVDDAHGFGTLGKTGAGAGEE